MKVLVVGGGGREHALAWKLAASPEVEELYCAPGNPGIGEVAEVVPVAADEVAQLAELAEDLAIDLTVVGPELPLTLGLADEFVGRGLAVFGPRRAAAELEGSKVFAKEFMRRHGIPTADFRVAHDADEARRAALELGLPAVVKADGLAAGKGVILVDDEGELDRALAVFFAERRFGSAGDRVVVEERLLGEELSFIALADGRRLLPCATARDYKRIGEGDTGPNTGGMGAHSPAGLSAPGIASRILEQVMLPTLHGMAEENRPFTGFLYAGLMLTADGPRVLEFNVRMGDPEAQPLLVRLDDDLAPLLASGAAGRFAAERLHFRREVAACVVLASRGYPGRPATGDPIRGLAEAAAMPGVEIFHAGTARQGGEIVAAGGRVLGVCASDGGLRPALRRAYAAAEVIDWPNKILRRDIGRRVLEAGAGAIDAPGSDGDNGS